MVVILWVKKNERRFIEHTGSKAAKIDADIWYYENATTFYVRSPLVVDGGEKKKQYEDGTIVQYGMGMVLAYTSQNYDTSNCGWYGCRVIMKNDNNDLIMNHGGDSPLVVTFI